MNAPLNDRDHAQCREGYCRQTIGAKQEGWGARTARDAALWRRRRTVGAFLAGVARVYDVLAPRARLAELALLGEGASGRAVHRVDELVALRAVDQQVNPARRAPHAAGHLGDKGSVRQARRSCVWGGHSLSRDGAKPTALCSGLCRFWLGWWHCSSMFQLHDSRASFRQWTIAVDQEIRT